MSAKTLNKNSIIRTKEDECAVFVCDWWSGIPSGVYKVDLKTGKDLVRYARFMIWVYKTIGLESVGPDRDERGELIKRFKNNKPKIVRGRIKIKHLIRKELVMNLISTRNRMDLEEGKIKRICDFFPYQLLRFVNEASDDRFSTMKDVEKFINDLVRRFGKDYAEVFSVDYVNGIK